MPHIADPKLRTVWYAFAAACSLAAFIVVSSWLVIHWHEPNLQRLVVGYVVDWIPCVLTILIAFVPDLRRQHVAWRLGIVAIGLIWSVLLARERYFSMNDQQQLVSAVTKSTEHTDEQIKNVRTDLENDLERVMADRLGALGKGLTTSLSELKPSPQQLATLAFRFFDSPGNTLSMHGGADGVFTIDFTTTDTAAVAAEKGDIWVEVCQACVFSKEPAGFDKPNGTAETVRHKTFGILNPGVSLETMTIDLKPPRGATSFEIAWSYSCETCGKRGDSQKFIIAILPPYKVTVPLPKLK